ncbi:response regulator [Zhongshania sp. BJYM1]|jgi:DNA-binding response OmpR family regulator|uniref:response regulator n=1 Tax=Zhongshania aquatica TaxID=2965069 RepID=UPI0022B320E6|nr:response regulator [Marortus sp. BJYM1]
MNTSVEFTKIMYVEDEPDIRLVAEIALKQVAGFDLKICSDGYEGLDEIGNFKPQLVLLDVMMPGMDGPQLLKRIKEMPEFADIPIVFMTAKAQADEVEKLKKMGAENVITKPFNPMTLGNEIRTIWQNYHESKQ